MNTGAVTWRVGGLALEITDPADRPAGIARLSLDGVPVAGGGHPLVEVGVRGLGSAWSARRYQDSVWTSRSRHAAHRTAVSGDEHILEIDSSEPTSGLRVTTRFTARPDVACLTVSSVLTNAADAPVTIDWATSAVVGGVGDTATDALRVHWADNDWLAEHRWHDEPFRRLLPDLSRPVHQHDSRSCFSRTAFGTWSTDGSLPMAALLGPTGAGLGWQIEHNGAWHWQIGESGAGAFVSLLGPTDREHQWSVRLEPGETFETVPATVALSTTGFHGVTDALTDHRRRTRREHRDRTALPIVFNDYMNTLMGDPTTAALEPLIDAAAEVGAEVFCIDAGWYDDDSQGWWDSVGAWVPAVSRFPGGLKKVTDRIAERGMVPGLWLEPEVVGVRSPIADTLPPAAFFVRDGERVVEHGRYHLDLGHPAARQHLDTVVDRLVHEFGIGYFKIDYNINPGPGTDRDGRSAGDGLLRHNRAHLAWIDGVLDRHPELILENCSSGGMRSDHALLSRTQLQSTSDQQDPLRYPPIAAAANAAILPEQAASWAYPQPDHDLGVIETTLAGGLLGRLYLSGHLDRLDDAQLRLVHAAVATYRQIRPGLAASHPFWPLGLPGWDDPWVAHGLRSGGVVHLAVWRRAGAGDTVDVPLPAAATAATVLFGDATAVLADDAEPRLTLRWDPASGSDHGAAVVRLDD